MSDEEFLRKATAGNSEAMRFLVAWNLYVHLIDDIVDGEAPAEDAIKVGCWANQLYALPFYVQHLAALQPLVMLITNNFEDAFTWEHADLAWQRQEADTVRHCGADMVRVVAYLCGGYALMRSISLDLRSIAYHSHHTAEGNPI